jgi:hypothetical protein
MMPGREQRVLARVLFVALVVAVLTVGVQALRGGGLESRGEPTVEADSTHIPASFLRGVGTGGFNAPVPATAGTQPVASLLLSPLHKRAHLFVYHAANGRYCMLWYYTQAASSAPIGLQSVLGCARVPFRRPIDFGEFGGQVTQGHGVVYGVVDAGTQSDRLQLLLSDGSSTALQLAELPRAAGPDRAGRAFLFDVGTARLVRADLVSASGAVLGHAP